MRSLICILVCFLGIALVGIATACGGSSPTAAVVSADDPNTVEEVEYRSPLAEFLGQDVGGFEFDEAEMIEQQRRAEQAIAECMAEQGFTYIPRDPAEFMSFGGPPDEEFEPGSDAWIAKYGFGISTQRFPQSAVGDLVGHPDDQFFGPPTEIVDPNQEYLEGLSDGEREAYQEALFGLPPDFGPEGPAEDFVFEPSGCQFQAFEDASGAPDNAREFYEAFGDELESMWQRIEADSRVVAFNDDIGSCVAEEGLQWTGFNDVYEQFEPRLNDLDRNSGLFRDPFEDAGLNPEEMSQEQIRDFVIESQRLDASQLAILAEIQADEIALAQAVIACGGGPVAEQKLMNEVRVEYEQAFLDANADELAEYGAD